MEEPALSIRGRQVETQQVDGDSEPAKAHVPSGLHMLSYHICPKVQCKRTNADNDIGPEACHTQVFGLSAPSHSLGSASRASMYPCPLKRSDHMPHYRPRQRAGEAELTKAASPARMERLGRRKEAGSS
jgi:hypothetical protein